MHATLTLPKRIHIHILLSHTDVEDYLEHTHILNTVYFENYVKSLPIFTTHKVIYEDVPRRIY